MFFGTFIVSHDAHKEILYVFCVEIVFSRTGTCSKKRKNILYKFYIYFISFVVENEIILILFLLLLWKTKSFEMEDFEDNYKLININEIDEEEGTSPRRSVSEKVGYRFGAVLFVSVPGAD